MTVHPASSVFLAIYVTKYAWKKILNMFRIYPDLDALAAAAPSSLESTLVTRGVSISCSPQVVHFLFSRREYLYWYISKIIVDRI